MSGVEELAAVQSGHSLASKSGVYCGADLASVMLPIKSSVTVWLYLK